MAKLSLHIVDDHGQTRTLIGKNKNYGEILFYNDSDQVLTVTFLHTNSIQDKYGLVISAITVGAGRQQSVWCDAGAATDTQVKYTAKIGEAKEEDPVIIFER